MDKDHMRWTRAGIRILVSLFSVRVLVCSTRVARLSNHRVQQSKQNTSPHRVAAATRPIENKGDEGTKGRNKGDTHLCCSGTKGKQRGHPLVLLSGQNLPAGVREIKSRNH